ncbi:MAG TPA: cation acetate symporter [Blastocatellia bacterium]|nr:cation acetate symporter [Blastocatellia bacterium]HMZ23012.1 cation acetate symporter [Blastocatellia bacterium]HNG30658.1 cation acetate symporter [Blastocatellia bacterium]
MNASLVMFVGFIAITLWITWWAARKNTGSNAYFAAGRSLTAWQNGIAVAGDYMSAASFLGIAGIIAFQGYDGFMYSVGWLVAYLTVLLIVAEPLRNAGKYTMADVLAYRLSPRPVRAMGALSTLTVSTFYMIAQMVGAGALVSLLLKDTGINFSTAVIVIGILMIVYVVFGGMLATTWVQIIKAILLMSGTILLSILVLKKFGFSFGDFFNAIAHVTYHDAKGNLVTQDFLTPGLRYKPPYGALDLISLGLALIFGTAGLPHILVRFYTVPDAKTARKSVVWAMGIIGTFYILTTFLGFGAATIVGRDFIAKNGGTNMSAPLLAQALAGDLFFAFISAIAFATILAVVAGLTISASTSFAHDFWTNVLHHGKERSPGEEVRVARVTAFVVGAVSITIAILLGPNANVAFLVALAFAVAASANLPVIVLSLFWRRFNTRGAVAGLATGLLSSLVLILLSPSIMKANAIFPLENPGIVSIPLGFLGACLGTLTGREEHAEDKFTELTVRANTGLGAEQATSH